MGRKQRGGSVKKGKGREGEEVDDRWGGGGGEEAGRE